MLSAGSLCGSGTLSGTGFVPGKEKERVSDEKKVDKQVREREKKVNEDNEVLGINEGKKEGRREKKKNSEMVIR